MTNLRLFVKEKYLRPRRAPSSDTKSQNSEQLDIIHRMTRNCMYGCVILMLLSFVDFLVRAEIWAELQFFWTGLRFFVKEKYLRSRRAPLAKTNIQNTYIVHIVMFWRFVDFHVRAEIRAGTEYLKILRETP